MLRRRRLLALAVPLAIALSGCAPAATPEPAPTPTALFETEAEAFAAAEEVYRAYIEETNKEYQGASAQSDKFLAGEALEAHIDTQRRMEEEGVALRGTANVSGFRGSSVDLTGSPQSVKAAICLDGADVRALDREGNDVTKEGRSDLYTVEITFVLIDDMLRITTSEPTSTSCDSF